MADENATSKPEERRHNLTVIEGGEPEPADSPAGGAHEELDPKAIKSKSRLIFDLMVYVRQYMILSRPQLLAIALYVLHTHCVEAASQTPYLSVKSPEKQCGKTRLLEILELLVARAWFAINPSEAVLYRKVHVERPTLLLDEVDTIFNPKSTSDRYEPHRSLINAGNRRGATVPRMAGPSQVLEFRVFCPKVLAGIGSLPETVADRSLPILLERKRKEETVERFYRPDAEPEAESLRERIEAWADDDRMNAIGQARPELPEQLTDRMQEGSEPLLAIADALGIGYEARAALVELCTEERLDNRETMRLRLLRDLWTIWEKREESKGKRVAGIPTNTIIGELWSIEDAPWATYYGRGLDPRDLASLLSHYNIGPQDIKTAKDKVLKGYRRDDLYDPWERYL